MTETEEISFDGLSVMVGMPIDNGMPPKTVMSMVQSFYRCGKLKIDLQFAMNISGLVQVGRDNVLDDFLKSTAQKLFWIDSDMVFTSDDFLRLLALSTKHDVICAAYPAKVEGPDTFYLNYDAGVPTNRYGLMPIKGVGLGFCIVDRKVCEQLAAKAPKVNDQISGREVASVFRLDIFDGHRRTEDMAFFADIRDLGHTVWLDPSIQLGHIGEREWRGDIRDALNHAAEKAA